MDRRAVINAHRKRHRRGIGSVLLPAVFLAVAGSVGYVLWDAGVFESQPLEEGPTVAATPLVEAAPYVYLSADGSWIDDTAPLPEDGLAPWQQLLAVSPQFIAATRREWPDALPDGLALGRVFAMANGVVVLDFIASGEGEAAPSIEEEAQILRSLCATALIYYPESSGVKMLFNGAERRIFLAFLCGDCLYPRAFFPGLESNRYALPQ